MVINSTRTDVLVLPLAWQIASNLDRTGNDTLKLVSDVVSMDIPLALLFLFALKFDRNDLV